MWSGTAARTFRSRRGGTALDGVTVAGKTGSLSVNKPSYLGVSWFVAYAPADKPEVIVSVVLGNPELWYIKAHTAARILLEKAMASRAVALLPAASQYTFEGVGHSVAQEAPELVLRALKAFEAQVR